MMDAYEFNKIAGAVLFTILVLLGLQNLAGVIYDAPQPEKPGFQVEVAEEASPGKAESATTQDVPLATLLASASTEKGQGQFRKCAACHTAEKGGANKVGPPLHGVLGRAKGGVDGFTYSRAMTAKGGEWTYEDIFGYLEAPKKWLPGTKMAFAGIKRADRRADLIAYLRTLSDSPLPLPKAAAGDTETDTQGTAPETTAPSTDTTDQ